LKFLVRGREFTPRPQRAKNLVLSGHKMERNPHVQRNTGEQGKVSKNTPLMPVMKSKAVPKTKIYGANSSKRVTDKSIGLGYLGPEKNVNHALDVWYKR